MLNKLCTVPFPCKVILFNTYPLKINIHFQVRIDELEDDLETERNFRIKAEQQRAGISLELKELQDRLEETGDANAVQMELNKRLDSV